MRYQLMIKHDKYNQDMTIDKEYALKWWRLRRHQTLIMALAYDVMMGRIP